MRNQKGLTISGFMTWAVIFAFVALLGFKLGPSYWEDMAITKMLRAMADDPDLATGNRGAIAKAFSLKSSVDNITAISDKDIEVSKNGNNLVLSATYTARVPLVYNLSACMDFAPTSAK